MIPHACDGQLGLIGPVVFFQILSTLHRVRAQYLELMGLPDDTKTVFTRAGWMPLPSPNLSASRKFGDGVERKDKMDGVDKKVGTNVDR